MGHHQLDSLDEQILKLIADNAAQLHKSVAI